MSEPPPPFDPYPWKRPVAWVTWIVLGSTIAVFLLQLLYSHRTGEDVIGDTLACGAQALADHRYWTLITYAWAHAVVIFGDPGLFWLHIVANMIPLICLGPALEDFLGHWRFLGLYLGGAIASALIWMYFNADADGIIGASGAIFALIAAAGTAAPRARVTVYLFYVLPIRMSLGIMAVVVCGIEVFQIVLVQMPALATAAHLNWFRMPEVAHSAHLGGAAFGFFYVMAIRLLTKSPPMLS